MGRKIYDRVVGKQGYLTHTGKVFGEMVKEWNKQARGLETLGYKIEYSIPDTTGQFRELLRITYPDGHSKIMTRSEAMKLGNLR